MMTPEQKSGLDTVTVSKGDRCIDFIRCYFCDNAKLDGKFYCGKGLTPADDCISFLKTQDITKRADEVFENFHDE